MCRFHLTFGLAWLAVVSAASAAPPAEFNEQLRQLQEQLAEIKASQAGGLEAGQAAGDADGADDADAAAAPQPLVLQDWHRNLSESQLRILARTMQPATFDEDAAPSPEDCLIAFRQAVKATESYEDVLPFLCRRRRQQYLLSEGHPSYKRYQKTDEEWLQPLKALLGSIVRVDHVAFDPTRDGHVQLLVWTAQDKTYTRVRIQMEGEGKLWRWVSFKAEASTTKPPAGLTVRSGRDGGRGSIARQLQPGQTDGSDLSNDLTLGEEFGD